MNRKDYQLVASTILLALGESRRKENIPSGAHIGITRLGLALAEAFEKENAGFRKDKFLEAAGLEEQG